MKVVPFSKLKSSCFRIKQYFCVSKVNIAGILNRLIFKSRKNVVETNFFNHDTDSIFPTHLFLPAKDKFHHRLKLTSRLSMLEIYMKNARYM
jgi:hypothetical protein